MSYSALTTLTKAIRINAAAVGGLVDHIVSLSKYEYSTALWPSRPYVSPYITPIVQHGSGNFTYLWSRVSGNTLNLYNGVTEATMTVRGQAFNRESVDVFKCVVTDTGNGNLEKEVLVLFNINWDLV